MTDKILNEKERASLLTLLMQGAPFPVIKKAIIGITPSHVAYWKNRFIKEGWPIPKRSVGRPAAIIPRPK